jgi:hypothetical protein
MTGAPMTRTLPRARQLGSQRTDSRRGPKGPGNQGNQAAASLRKARLSARSPLILPPAYSSYPHLSPGERSDDLHPLSASCYDRGVSPKARADLVRWVRRYDAVEERIDSERRRNPPTEVRVALSELTHQAVLGCILTAPRFSLRAAQQCVHPTSGIRRVFEKVFWLGVFSAFAQNLRPPTCG